MRKYTRKTMFFSVLSFLLTACSGPFTHIIMSHGYPSAPNSPGDGRQINALAMLSPTDGWAGGGVYSSQIRNGFVYPVPVSGALLHYNGTTWSYQGESQPIRSLSFVSSSVGWGAGTNGYIIHFDGTQWTQQQSPASVNLNGVSAVSANEAWAVGNAGTILHYTNGAWAQATSPTTNALNAVAMVSATEGWAAGAGGIILHYISGSWQIVAQPAIVTTDQSENKTFSFAGQQIVYPTKYAGTTLYFDIESILVVDTQHVWFGASFTWDGGSYATGNPSVISYIQGQWHVYADNVLGPTFALAIDNQQRIWSFGFWGEAFFDGTTWTSLQVSHEGAPPQNMQYQNAYTGTILDRTVWFGITGGQIYTYNDGMFTLSYSGW